MNKWINFKTYNKEIEGIGLVVFSECEQGIWHDIAHNLPISSYILVTNNRISLITKDPTLIVPYDGDNVFQITDSNLKVGDFVYFDGLNLVKIEAPEYPIFDTYNGEKWITSLSLEEQLEFYKNRMSQVYKKIKEQKEEIEFIGFGEVDPKLYEELEKLKQKHMEVSHELALEMNK